MAVENDDLTSAGLVAKLSEWDEAEHGVPAWLYDDIKRTLKKTGVKIPADIRRIEEKRHIKGFDEHEH